MNFKRDSTEDSARYWGYAKSSREKGGHWRYSGARSSSGSNDEEENEYDNIEDMDENISPEDQFQVRMGGGFILKVYKASILSLRVDTIVNAANDTMSHGEGVAYVISQAAGHQLDGECYEYVKSHGKVRVTDNIVTTAGKLKNKYKGVIHAVGPMWRYYSDKMSCLDDLYDCIIKIFVTCDKERFASVGMPAIGTGIFAVPQELCADMYVKAAADYSSMIKKGKHTYPKELHIIDVNERIDLVKESVRKWEKDPKSVDQQHVLPKYLDDHPHLKRSGGAWSSDYKFEKGRGFSKRDDGKQSSGGSRHGGGSYRRQQSGEDDTGTSVLDVPIIKMPEERFRWGGTAMLYGVGHLKVKIFKGDVVKAANVDAIICRMREGMESSGFLAEALKKEGGQAYQEDFNKRKKSFGFPKGIMRCQGGYLKVDYVVHVVQKHIKDANEEEVKSYQKTIYKVLKESADHWKFQRIVVPMIGTELIQSNKSKLQKCCVAILQALEKYLDKFDHTASLKEVHLVNNNEAVCKVLTDVFDAAAGLKDTNSGENRGSNSYGGYGDSNRRDRRSSPVSNNGRGYDHSNRRNRGSSPGSSNDGRSRRKAFTKDERVEDTGYNQNNTGGTNSYPHSSGSRKGRPLPSVPGAGKQNVCDDDGDAWWPDDHYDEDHHDTVKDVRDARRKISPLPLFSGADKQHVSDEVGDSKGGRKTFTKDGRVVDTGFSQNNTGGTDSYLHFSGSRTGRPLPSVPGDGKENVCDDDGNARWSDDHYDEDHHDTEKDVRDASRKSSPLPIVSGADKQHVSDEVGGARGGRITFIKEGQVGNAEYIQSNTDGTDLSGSMKSSPLSLVPGAGKQNVADEAGGARWSHDNSSHFETLMDAGLEDVRDARKTQERQEPKKKGPTSVPSEQGCSTQQHTEFEDCVETHAMSEDEYVEVARGRDATPDRPMPTFLEALKKWRDAKLNEDCPPITLLIHKKKLLESTRRAFTRKGFNYLCPVKVAFTGDDREDYGGPKREFFSLLMKELKGVILENGSLCHSKDKLKRQEYFFTGRCIAWSIIHGGPGFPFLKAYVLEMVLNQVNTKFVLDDAPSEARIMLEQLQEAETIDKTMSDWLIDVGISPPFVVERKKQLKDVCLKQILYYRIQAELSQFREGLNSFHFLDSMVEYRSELESLLCVQHGHTSFAQAKKMIKINYSEEGSNDRETEVDTAYAFDTFLQDCTEDVLEVNYGDLLAFWTGTSTVPPLGFDKQLEINFVNGQEKLPVAHTCELSLELPRCVSPEDMQAKMVNAIQLGGAFHLM